MKLIRKILLIVFILLIIMTEQTSAVTPTFSIKLEAEKTSALQGEEITITLKLENITNMNTGLYACFAEIEYDETYFEVLDSSDLVGEGTWSSPTYNPENNQFITDSNTGIKIDGDVLSITFKVKANAPLGTTSIRVKNFQASEGEIDLNANNDATINIEITETEENNGNNDNNSNDNTNGSNNNNGNNNEQNNDNDDNNDNNDNVNNGNNGNSNDNNNNGSNSSNNNSNNNGGNSNNKNNDMTTANDQLPKTGENMAIIIIAVILSCSGIIGYVQYRRMKEIK